MSETPSEPAFVIFLLDSVGMMTDSPSSPDGEGCKHLRLGVHGKDQVSQSNSHRDVCFIVLGYRCLLLDSQLYSNRRT